MNECFNFKGQRITNHKAEVHAKKYERHRQGSFVYDGVKDVHGKSFWYVVLSKPANVNLHEQAIRNCFAILHADILQFRIWHPPIVFYLIFVSESSFYSLESITENKEK